MISHSQQALGCETKKRQMATSRASNGNFRAQSFLCCLLVLVLFSGAFQVDGTPVGKNNSMEDSATVTTLHQELSSQQGHGESMDTYWKCPQPCLCSYFDSSRTLHIDCSEGRHVNPAEGSDLELRLEAGGVDHLSWTSVTVDSTNVEEFYPRSRANHALVTFTLVDVKFDPLVVLNHPLFTSSRHSLREISLTNVSPQQSSFSRMKVDVYPIWVEDMVVLPFSTLTSLDSLIICDGDAQLAQLLLHKAPPVHHIKVVNSHLTEFQSISESSLSSLRSLNVSHNQILRLPDYIFSRMKNLTLLDVSHNIIQHLQEQVFLGLDALQVLIASHNNIHYIDIDVFQPLSALKTVDLSHNRVIQFFEPYFVANRNLTAVYMSSFWTPHSFINYNTASYSRTEMEHMIDSLQSVETLDISDNQMKVIPETLAHLPTLSRVMLQGNLWECTCEDIWLFEWMATTKVSFGLQNVTDNLWCHSYNGVRLPLLPYLTILQKNCNTTSIASRTPTKNFAKIGESTILHCHPGKIPWPSITWITPQKQEFSPEVPGNRTGAPEDGMDSEPSSPISLFQNGSLRISTFEKKDLGLYLCVASYENLNITHYVHVGLDISFFAKVQFQSIIVGWTFSLLILFIVLLTHFIRWSLNKYVIFSFLVYIIDNNRIIY